MRRTPLAKINRKRIKKLRAKQFGTDGKREWVLGLASCVTNRVGHPGDPMTPSHVLGSRGAGGGPGGMVPMLASENTDWDSLDSAAWRKKYRVGKPTIRTRARALEREWRAIQKESQ